MSEDSQFRCFQGESNCDNRVWFENRLSGDNVYWNN